MAVIVTFCSVFSVRLGSIIVGALCLMQVAVLEIACVLGLQDVQSVSQNLNEFMYEKDLLFLTSFLNGVKKNPEPYFTAALVILAVYSFSCVLLIYGALKLNAWLIMPFVALEFLRVCLNFAALVTGMILLKKNSLDLGPLMGGCTGGGFAMLLLLYMWSCPLSLAQELMFRRRQGRALKKQNHDDNTAAMEAKLWQQRHGLGYPGYPGYPSGQSVITKVPSSKSTDHQFTQYITQYPAVGGAPYRGYPIYIE